MTTNLLFLKKYFYFSKVAIQDLAAYPSRFFSNLYVDGLSLVMFYFLWKALYSNREVVNGFTFNAIVTYYALTFALRKLTNSKTITRRISRSIKYGMLSTFLLQPMNFIWHYFFRITTQVTFQTIIPLVLIGTFTLYFRVLQMPTNLGLFLISLGFAVLITFFFYAIVGLIAFWTTESWGIVSAIGRVESILAGYVIPLTFFPSWLENFNNYLPFKHMTFTPVSIYLGNINGREAYINIIVQLIWSLILILVFNLVWKKALIKYDSVGN